MIYIIWRILSIFITINEVNFVLEKVYDNSIRADIKVYCNKCKCDENCGNSQCLDFTEKEIQEEIKKEEQKELILQLESTEVVENQRLEKGGILAAVLVLFFLIIGIFILLKRT